MGGMHATDPAPPTLLLVEDDPIVRAFLADNLTADGYAVLVADTLADGLRALEYRKPDAAIVDVGLPDGSGLDLVTRVRAAGRVATRLDPGLPLVVLSGRAGELDRIRSFDKGADDFVSKPFSYGELRRRVEALLRRAGERRSSGLLRVGALEVDPVGRDVRLDGERVVVSAKEFALLLALAAEPSRVFTKEELLRDVWGFRAMGTTRTLDSHACRLRRKLGGALRGQRVGRRLPAGRRPGAGARGMTGLLATLVVIGLRPGPPAPLPGARRAGRARAARAAERGAAGGRRAGAERPRDGDRARAAAGGAGGRRPGGRAARAP